MKYLILLSFLFNSCSDKIFTPNKQIQFTHSCPKNGHGPCYLCDSQNNSKKFLTFNK